MNSTNNSSVVRCHGCDNWYRVWATEVVSTADEGDTFAPQRWCVMCLGEIDDNTNTIVKQFSEYPDGLPAWDAEETAEQNENENENEEEDQ